jgi:S-adenosylmethionine/arginine decarboxylase-like enzyme
LLKHQHLIVRAEIASPPYSESYIKQWLENLIGALKMKVLMGPFAKYCDVVGNRGLTAVAIIETSHVVLHTWDEDEVAVMQLDVYSCSEVDPNIIWNAIEEFKPTHIDYKFLDRENGLTELPLP